MNRIMNYFLENKTWAMAKANIALFDCLGNYTRPLMGDNFYCENYYYLVLSND